MTTDSSHASPGDSSTGQLSPALAVDLDGERRLAAAVLERAALDLAGGRIIFKNTRAERNASNDAEQWVEEAGEGFRYWCDVTGRHWSYVRRVMLTRRQGPYIRRRARWLARGRGTA